ncbi:MFS transporter [Planotetraspora thailandica]|uniref:MFS transporter n=1 Tax=Planotetraspora thailandica TaxID=487172 RepID=A0A8J3V174_9ACTN|nr:MFS transporter [Planotetraspora thailandica]
MVLDISIVNIALPHIRQALAMPGSSQQWIINAYTIVFAGFLLLGGRVADLYGRRRFFLIGMTLFTVASLACGLAWSGAWIIAARAAQGLGAALLAPATLSLLTSRFTDPHERRRALGAWSTTAAGGAAIGVLSGGIITDLLDWRWVFFVNVPIGAAVVLLALTGIREAPAPATRPALDLWGAATVTLGLAAIVYGLVSDGPREWGALLLGAVLVVAFVVIEVRVVRHPLVPFSVFRSRPLTAANGVGIAINAVLIGTYFFLTLYLQGPGGYSPLQAGFAFLPIGLATFTGSLTSTRLVRRIGVRPSILLGTAIGTAGLLWLAAALDMHVAYGAHLLGPLILFGLGTGSALVPLTLAATHGVPPHQAGLASGLINTSRQMGGAIGLAVMTAVAAHASRHTAVAGYQVAFLVAAAFLFGGLLCGAAIGRAGPPRG